MENAAPILLWIRKDFRLSDHPALSAAASAGRPVIPVFVCDEVMQTYGAAPIWRLEQAISRFSGTLEGLGSKLILRRGLAVDVLLSLVKETGATDVWWTRAYDPEAVARDTDVKARLKDAGFGAKSFPGHILFEPWTVSTKQGGFFKVYSPMWRAVKNIEIEPPTAAPKKILAPRTWPASDQIDSWQLARGMNRGAAILAQSASIGEAAAAKRLAEFLENKVNAYKDRRDFPAEHATSNLSENLAWGEIGPRTIWHAGMRALQEGANGAEHFLKEVVWREFAYHLVYHTPQITSRNWRSEWDTFPWSESEDDAVLRWKQGRTGVPLVDAAMREMYVTGRMHNRGRMIVGSYLTKHMMKHWRIGQRWFAECLTDWDPASNAMGWQWVAGSGPDAAPYFRVFNPETQAQKFDADGAYVRRFLAERTPEPGRFALAFFQACPRSWNLSPDNPVPQPLVGLAEGRRIALAAYENRQA